MRPPSPDLCNLLPCAKAPKPCVPCDWPTPLRPASSACAPTSGQARTHRVRPVVRPIAPQRRHRRSATVECRAGHLRGSAQPVLSPARVLSWGEADPGGEVSPLREGLHRRCEGGDRRRCHRAYSRDRCQPLCSIIRSRACAVRHQGRRSSRPARLSCPAAVAPARGPLLATCRRRRR